CLSASGSPRPADCQIGNGSVLDTRTGQVREGDLIDACSALHLSSDDRTEFIEVLVCADQTGLDSVVQLAENSRLGDAVS
ncbi:hypothetical protein NPN26_25730, partial [Vibrio parahaemolyticus]|nr:hypothetical protein [Vibrio parahaemolyticus]